MSLVLQPCCDHELSVETSFLLMAFFFFPKVLITNCLCCRQSQLLCGKIGFSVLGILLLVNNILLFLLYSGFSYFSNLGKYEERKKYLIGQLKKEHQSHYLNYPFHCQLSFVLQGMSIYESSLFAFHHNIVFSFLLGKEGGRKNFGMIVL